MKKHSLAISLAIALLAGCQAYPGGPATQPAATFPGMSVAARALQARVAFPTLRQVLATEAEVKALATVSLMSTAGATLASGVTDQNGAVTLTLGQDVNLAVDTCYVLEAVKGLSANAPGKDAVRLRTIVRWTAAGWTSLTSATPGAATINKLTTAVAITAGLDADIDPATLMGIVDATGAGSLTRANAFGAVADATVTALADTIGDYVTGDVDPIATANGFSPAVTGLSAATGEVGTILTITGTGFNPLPGQTVVTIGGQAATVIAATSTKVYCVVPTLAPGARAVVVSGAAGGDFTVTASGPTLTAASLTHLYEGATLTLTGTGFDTTAAANKVMFGSVAATPTAATATSLTVTVPAGFGTDVQVLVPGAKTNTLTVAAATTTSLAILADNKASGGVWSGTSITRDLTGYPNGGTGASGSVTLGGGAQGLPASANFVSLSIPTANTVYSSGADADIYVQGDLTLGANTTLGTRGADGSGGAATPGPNLTLHVGGELIMGANSAIQSVGGAETYAGIGAAGGNVTVYAHGYTLDPSARIESVGSSVNGNTAGPSGTVTLHYGSGSQPSAVFNPTPAFVSIDPVSTQEAVSKGYDIGGSGHTAVTYLGFAKTEAVPTGTAITYAFSDSADGEAWGAWTSDITTLTQRYVRFKATMTTDTLNVTPTLTGLSVHHAFPVVN